MPIWKRLPYIFKSSATKKQASPAASGSETGPDIASDLKRRIEDAFLLSESIVRGGHEVVPRFEIETPDGDFQIMVPLPDDIDARLLRFDLIRQWMAYRMATRFLFVSELVEPDALSCIAVSRDDTFGLVRMIERDPVSIGPIEMIDGELVGDEIPAMLPRGVSSLSAVEIAELDRAIRVFSPDSFRPS